MIWPW